ncbi:hypothetical protein GQ457_09G017530 [Hibiscus cannabinus]
MGFQCLRLVLVLYLSTGFQCLKPVSIQLARTGTHAKSTDTLFGVPVRTGTIPRVPVPNSCRSAFNAGLKLPNDSIDDLNNHNGWKSMKKYKNMFLKLQQQEESHPRAKNPILVNI